MAHNIQSLSPPESFTLPSCVVECEPNIPSDWCVVWGLKGILYNGPIDSLPSSIQSKAAIISLPPTVFHHLKAQMAMVGNENVNPV